MPPNHPRPWKISDTGSPKEAFALARQYPPERMRIVQEGFDKLDRYRAPADEVH